ncbi:MAG TPA: hypothetical protein VFT50_11800 [Baekduia sp.]|nr:hypothetical protein [Baekduia sp.]
MRSAFVALLAAGAAATVPAGAAAHSGGAAHGGGRGAHGDLGRARAATAAFRTAPPAGRGVLADAAGITCIDNPGVGGMGIHYVDAGLVGDDQVHVTRPEALVYEPQAGGGLRLGALEYVVFQAKWDAAHRRPPRLFGRKFELVAAGNRYGLDAFYELHVWAWKHNPRGLFDDWNPRVSCAVG